MHTALAFANDDHAPVARPRLRLVPAAPGLSAMERQAVEIGRDDAFRPGWDASIAAPSWAERVATFLARTRRGMRAVVPLADPRLEKLRLFASMMRRDDRRLHDLADALLADGLSSVALHEAIGLALV
ncbi:hypothetical protein [Sphingomonas sp.]|uniref:hypothetical protein n=1 Tax=Sphingomonas sp. TaxID=28214 RepID=UPI0025D0EB56|nr:hypothetical protein [Sphingomonas sp.]